MKTATANLTVLSLMLATSVSFGQSAEKTLVKSFNLQGHQVVELDLKGNVEVKEWNNDIMRIQMTIGLPSGNSSQLKALVRAGRYNLLSKPGVDNYKVFSPGMKRNVKIKGHELNENLTYVVFVPRDVIVKQSETATASNTGIKAPASMK